MGSQERKAKEKDAFRKLIIATAHDLIAAHGLRGLTMRSLAQTIDYSQSKIYEFFKNKDQLCEVICEEICEKMLAIVRAVPQNLDPETYLTTFIVKNLEFHADYPHSDEILTLVCFGPQRFKIPQAYHEVVDFHARAIRNLNSPHILTDDDVLIAMDIIRCFKIGMSNLMSSETSVQGKRRANAMIDNAVKVLLRGWK